MPFGAYARHGWVLCPISRGSKSPTNAGWNKLENGVTEPEVADQLDGAGLMHAYSGTCAIDVDDMDKATAWCAARGVDLPALFADPTSVQISSGKAKHGKLLYRIAEPMRGKQITEDKHAIIDFRCATATGASQQDVLPPTMHPDTEKPYGWLQDSMVADWSCLPPIPDALLELWRAQFASAPPPDATAPAPVFGFEEVQAVLLGCDPDSSRDEWVKILAAVHHATHGSDEGLALATAWSAQGKKYVGAEDVATRWRSFSLNHPKPMTIASLRRDEPATADEFPDILPETPSTDAQAPGAPAVAQSKEQKTAARKELETRLVYVRAIDKYFDKQTRDVLLSDHAIAHRFTPFMPKVRGERIDPVKLLKESTLRGIVDAVGFHPGEGAIFTDRGDEYANYYRPRIPTPLEPNARELDCINWLFARIDDVVFRDWLTAFLAHVIQKPGIKIQSAPLIWSEIYGNGKSTLLKTIPSLLVGLEYSQEVSYALLESNFNDFLLRAWHVNLTEFRATGRAERTAIAAKLKPWITDASISIHPKGLPAYSIPNRIVVTATSNEADAAPLEEGDRRWGVYEMTAPEMTEAEGMALYDDFLHTERAAGVLRHYFLNQSITGFNPAAAPPKTKSRTEMIEATIASDVELLRTALEECKGPFARDVCTGEDVQNYVHEHLRFRPSAARIGRLMHKYPFEGQAKQIRYNGAKYRVWVIRNHGIWADAGEATLSKYLMDEEINPLPVDPLTL